MRGGRLRRLGRIAGWTGSGLAGLALAVLLVAWSGVFNVAASRGHWAIVEWFLAFGMRNSVELRAMAVQSQPLDDRPRCGRRCVEMAGLHGDVSIERMRRRFRKNLFWPPLQRISAAHDVEQRRLQARGVRWHHGR